MPTGTINNDFDINVNVARQQVQTTLSPQSSQVVRQNCGPLYFVCSKRRGPPASKNADRTAAPLVHSAVLFHLKPRSAARRVFMQCSARTRVEIRPIAGPDARAVDLQY